MTDNARNSGGKQKGNKGAGNETLLALYDSLEDLYSILETLDELGIKTRDELIAYIDTLDNELEELESLGNG
ncbi:MAG: hypothetical protein M3490_06165 [Chloroflexota bacterium]|nr:hypothetical protein [Chloroflexota bacterium]